MKQDQMKLIAKVTVPLLIALLSVFVLSNFAASTKYNAATIEVLDEKKTDVMQLAAASTAASVAITLIPGDTATPVAEKLADLSGYFLFVLTAIYLEKYLVTITGYLAFKILIPIACVIFSANVYFKNEALRRIAAKLAVFAMVIFIVIPASVKISNLIEATYSSSIEETIDTAKESTKTIKDSAAESAEAGDEEEGFFSGLLSKIDGSVSDLTANFENMLSNFIEAIAVLIVTSCVIPIGVLMFFAWFINLVLGSDIQIPKKGFKIKR